MKVVLTAEKRPDCACGQNRMEMLTADTDEYENDVHVALVFFKKLFDMITSFPFVYGPKMTSDVLVVVLIKVGVGFAGRPG